LSEILPFLACYALARRGQLERIEYGIYRVPLISPSRLDQHACSAVGPGWPRAHRGSVAVAWPARVRLVAAVAHLPGQVAGADGSGVAAGIVVSIRDQEDRVALRVVVEARVRFRLPGEHGYTPSTSGSSSARCCAGAGTPGASLVGRLRRTSRAAMSGRPRASAASASATTGASGPIPVRGDRSEARQAPPGDVKVGDVLLRTNAEPGAIWCPAIGESLAARLDVPVVGYDVSTCGLAGTLAGGELAGDRE